MIYWPAIAYLVRGATDGKADSEVSSRMQCWPRWLQHNPDAIFANTDPETLPLSATVKQALTQWADALDKHL